MKLKRLDQHICEVGIFTLLVTSDQVYKIAYHPFSAKEKNGVHSYQNLTQEEGEFYMNRIRLWYKKKGGEENVKQKN